MAQLIDLHLSVAYQVMLLQIGHGHSQPVAFELSMRESEHQKPESFVQGQALSPLATLVSSCLTIYHGHRLVMGTASGADVAIAYNRTTKIALISWRGTVETRDWLEVSRRA